MIKDYDRSKYFGASDCKYIFAGNQNSTSWMKWWQVKCGTRESFFGGTVYTQAGNIWEHSILKAFNKDIVMDGQIIIDELRLRVNYDGFIKEWGGTTIVECKTHRGDKAFEISDSYWQQAQMQMYAWNNQPKAPDIFCVGKEICDTSKLKRHIIISYGLAPDEYCMKASAEDIDEGNLPVDASRIEVHEVKYARGFQRRIPKVLRRLAMRLDDEEAK